jgi:hypothetical protein
MPLKIIPDESNLEVNGAGIKKNEIIELMQCYAAHTGKSETFGGPFTRHSPEKDVISGWFPLEEVLDFLVSNGVNVTYTNVGDLGLRIYFGMHHRNNQFQPKPALPTTPASDYYFKDTPILVVTQKNKTKGDADYDLLDSGNYVTLGGGQGLDNARLCPPECNGGM